MSRESREFRPFVSDRGLQRTLNLAIVWCGPDACRAGATIALEPHVIGDTVPCVEWAEDEMALESFREGLSNGVVQTGLAPALTSLVVLGRSPYAKRQSLLFSHSLADLATLERRVELQEALELPRIVQSPEHGYRLTIALCLNQSVSPADPLCPRRKGYWLARSHYVIATSGSWQAIRYRPMTDSDRDTYGLDPRCTRYLPLDQGTTTQSLSEIDPPQLLVDNDVGLKLEEGVSIEAARLAQKELCQFVFSSIIWQYSMDQADPTQPPVTRDPDEMLADSLIGWVIRRVTGQSAIDFYHREFLELADTNPDRLVAKAEAAIDLKAEIIAAVSRG